MKKFALGAMLAVSLTFTGCLGPNNLTSKLNNWNAEITTQDWANELIFIPLSPVHLLAWFSDVLVFNTWDYWAGDNPISDPGTFPASFGEAK